MVDSLDLPRSTVADYIRRRARLDPVLRQAYEAGEKVSSPSPLTFGSRHSGRIRPSRLDARFEPLVRRYRR